ncbi:hypothetical protein EVAR_41400_1 [Eumeta japonica]|uniref:Uncharacterized protein n=1 Tax=Eumeta variegata TaxID=151549 RepID=A0A4C1WZ54_EUMVA|nr:hypothetical protein EVAR_41400_1 [Eumeta japonica]
MADRDQRRNQMGSEDWNLKQELGWDHDRQGASIFPRNIKRSDIRPSVRRGFTLHTDTTRFGRGLGLNSPQRAGRRKSGQDTTDFKNDPSKFVFGAIDDGSVIERLSSNYSVPPTRGPEWTA